MKNINKMLLKGAVKKCERKMIFARLDDVDRTTAKVGDAMGGLEDRVTE